MEHRNLVAAPQKSVHDVMAAGSRAPDDKRFQVLPPCSRLRQNITRALSIMQTHRRFRCAASANKAARFASSRERIASGFQQLSTSGRSGFARLWAAVMRRASRFRADRDMMLAVRVVPRDASVEGREEEFGSR
jgi:hypothetical protein